MTVLWNIVSVLGAIVLGLVLLCVALAIVFMLVLMLVAAVHSCIDAAERNQRVK